SAPPDGSHDPHPVDVGDEEVARAVEGQPRRVVQAGLDGGTTVAREAVLARAGKGRDDPSWAYLADAVVVGVGDEEVAGVVHRQPPDVDREVGGRRRRRRGARWPGASRPGPDPAGPPTPPALWPDGRPPRGARRGP